MQKETPEQFRGPSAEAVGKGVIIGVILLIIGAIIYTYSQPSGDTVAKKNEIESFEIGKPFLVGRVEFTVHEITKQKGGEDIQLITVKYSAKNNGSKEVSISSNNAVLIDFVERKHESQISSEDPGSLNPGVKKDGIAEFEVPIAIGRSYIGFRADMFDFGGADYGFVEIP